MTDWEISHLLPSQSFSTRSLLSCSSSWVLGVPRVTMKFRFVGGMNCPDWILAEIAEFSKITAIRFRVWCSVVADHIKLGDRQWGEDHLKRLNPDGHIEERMVRGMIAALLFVFEKAAKYRCSPADLELEMQQLGLPSEHCKQMQKVYAVQKDDLCAAAAEQIHKEPSFSIASHTTDSVDGAKVHLLKLHTSGGDRVEVAMSAEKLRVLKRELQVAAKTLAKFS
ncbi:hypothetical protein QR680_009104 [Steinernema hermaphroditum]|uniref:COMM domain-containing protein n=1 Tax=Steinernema hermaphroditum TaxID=289476 RepID=A0AA39M9A6_9BILA|nr:hypothetical protein QR680_009104 [Steinernema hermaphroditum]